MEKTKTIKNMFKMFSFLFVVFLLFGQSVEVSALGGSVFVELNPSYVSPNSPFTVSLKSYSVDLDSSDVIWILDNKTVSKGLGIKSLKVVSPDLGKTKELGINRDC